jgi:hypothetical protein
MRRSWTNAKGVSEAPDFPTLAITLNLNFNKNEKKTQAETGYFEHHLICDVQCAGSAFVQ